MTENESELEETVLITPFRILHYTQSKFGKMMHNTTVPELKTDIKTFIIG